MATRVKSQQILFINLYSVHICQEAFWFVAKQGYDKDINSTRTKELRQKVTIATRCAADAYCPKKPPYQT